jgi:acyl-CoA thioester hydrolase
MWGDRIMEIKIYYQDTDCGGVVYYANYLTYFERDRTEWMESRGVSVKGLADQGILFVVSRAELEYKSPAFYGETLKLRTELVKMSIVRFELKTRVEDKATGRLVVEGSCVMACVDKDLKPRKIPEEIKSRLCP